MDLIKLIFLIVNTILIPIYGLLCCILVSVLVPYNIFDNKEMSEIYECYNSFPLLNIEQYDSRIQRTALFGGYKGFKGGHKYKNCVYLFPGECADDFGREVYCPKESYSYSDEEEEPQPLDHKTCVDYYEIRAFSYDKLKGKYYYATKMSKTYEQLLNETVDKNENCPNTKKNCGFLNKEKKLCLSTKDECPINDVVINNKPIYINNGITYNSVEFGTDYIHFTNKKTNNDILSDLLISIESPLSKIEIDDKLYKKNIFKLHELEFDIYYKGNIDKIIVYKKLFDTGITLQQLFIDYGVYKTIIKEPNYKTQYFKSKIFVYKKYPVPLNGKPKQALEDTRDSFRRANSCIAFSGMLFIISLFMSIWFITQNNLLTRIISYILLTMLNIGIIMLFIISRETLLHAGILVYYKDKNHNRIQLLVFAIFHIIVAIYQNLSTLYFWIYIHKLEKFAKAKKNEKALLEKGNGYTSPLYPM